MTKNIQVNSRKYAEVKVQKEVKYFHDDCDFATLPASLVMLDCLYLYLYLYLYLKNISTM